jgi:RNA polymerase sigma-70 factor (ECF subfamily)
VQQYQADVYGLCLRLVGDRHEAEDVAQEVFLRVFRSLHRWDPKRPLRPWILAIAVNRCRTLLVQRRRRPEPVPDLSLVPSRPDPGADAELLREIGLAVQGLRPEYRIAFVMFHEQGRPYEFIAQALSRPVGTIKTWLHRARLAILERLKRRGMLPGTGHEMS